MRATRLMVTGAMFVAAGLLLPMLFHAVGMGKVFLPMHIPVLLAGLLCGGGTGLLVGAVTPPLSSMLTGMPPLPVAQAMCFELAVYGGLAGLLYRRFKLGVMVSLLVAMFGGRLVYGILGAVVLPFLGLKRVSPLYPLSAGLVTGLPGVAIQLVLIPLVVRLVERTPWLAGFFAEVASGGRGSPKTG